MLAVGYTLTIACAIYLLIGVSAYAPWHPRSSMLSSFYAFAFLRLCFSAPSLFYALALLSSCALLCPFSSALLLLGISPVVGGRLPTYTSRHASSLAFTFADVHPLECASRNALPQLNQLRDLGSFWN